MESCWKYLTPYSVISDWNMDIEERLLRFMLGYLRPTGLCGLLKGLTEQAVERISWVMWDIRVLRSSVKRPWNGLIAQSPLATRLGILQQKVVMLRNRLHTTLNPNSLYFSLKTLVKTVVRLTVLEYYNKISNGSIKLHAGHRNGLFRKPIWIYLYKSVIFLPSWEEVLHENTSYSSS